MSEEVPCSAVGLSAVLVIMDLKIVGFNPIAYAFFNLFFSSQGILEDIADQIEKNFQGNVVFTLCRHFTSETQIESLKGQFLCFNCGLNSNLHLVCLRFYVISDTLSCKESKSANGNRQYVLFSRYFLLF